MNKKYLVITQCDDHTFIEHVDCNAPTPFKNVIKKSEAYKNLMMNCQDFSSQLKKVDIFNENDIKGGNYESDYKVIIFFVIESYQHIQFERPACYHLIIIDE